MKEIKNQNGLVLSEHIEPNGFVAIMSALFLLVIGGAVGVSLILLGLANSRNGFAIEQSSQARALADACTERALDLIRQSIVFSGTATVSMGQGSCTYTVTKGVGQNRTIVSSGTVGTIIRKVNASISKITPFIILTSWQEVP